MPTTDGTQSDQAGEAAPTPARTGASLAGAGGDARAEGGLERAAEWMTEASRTLTREADELNACSLDLSALANGTLRDAATADAAARAAQLQASAALIAAGRELSADRAGREELEACVIQAHLLRQLVLELLAAASNSTPTPATALCPVAENAGLAGHAPERRWAPLGAECLQAVDRLTETAAEGRLHLKAAEQAAASRRQTLELLSQELHGLATASSSVVRMTSSQVDYGHTIAHLGARLALGMTCLNEDLQKNLRCE